MNSDKSKENIEQSEENAEALTTAERSRISDVFDEENDDDLTVVDEMTEKLADAVQATKKPVEAVSKEVTIDVVDDSKETQTNADDSKETIADVDAEVADVDAEVADVIDDPEAIVDVLEGAKGEVDEVFGNDGGQTPDVDNSDDGDDGDGEVKGIAAFFNHPDHLMYAAEQARDAKFEKYDAYSPFPIHGMDDAMGLERSWIPWVTFGAGLAGFCTAFGLQFGMMGFDWPMIFGGKPFIAWPSFVPILFELTVLFAGVTTGFVALVAAGCFRKPFIIDKDITNDQFVLWISADDQAFDIDSVIDFMKKLNPHTIRAIREGHK